MSQSAHEDDQDQPEDSEQPSRFALDSQLGAQALDSALRLIPPPLAAAARAAAAQPVQVDDLHDVDVNWDCSFVGVDDILFGNEGTEYLCLDTGSAVQVALPADESPQVHAELDTSAQLHKSEPEEVQGKSCTNLSVERNDTPASHASTAQEANLELSQLDSLGGTNATSAVKRSLSQASGAASTPPPKSANVVRRARNSPSQVAKRARIRPTNMPVAKSSLIPIAPRAAALKVQGGNQGSSAMQTSNSKVQVSAPSRVAVSTTDSQGRPQTGVTGRSPASNVSPDPAIQPLAPGFAQQQSHKSSMNMAQSFAMGMGPHMMSVINANMYPLQHHQSMFPPPSPQQVVSPTERKDRVEATSAVPANVAPGAGKHKKMRVGDPPVPATPSGGAAGAAGAGGSAAVSQHQQFFPAGLPIPPTGVIPYDPNMMQFFMAPQMYLAAAAAGYPMGPMHMGNPGMAGNLFPQFGMGSRSGTPGPSKLPQENAEGNIENNTANAPSSADFGNNPQPTGVSEEGPSVATPQASFLHMGRQPKFSRLQLQSMGRKMTSAGSGGGKVGGSMRMTDTQEAPRDGSPQKGTFAVGGTVPNVKASASSQVASSSRTDAEQPRAQKKRLVWTPELHERFVKAIDLVGLQQAVPKMLVNIMNVDGLTTEHVKSHLQKYRNSIRKEQAEEARERSQGVAGAHAGRGMRLPGTGTTGNLSRAGLGVTGVGSGVRKYPVLPNRISLFGTPNAPGVAPAGIAKASAMGAGSRTGGMTPRSSTRTPTPPPARSNAGISAQKMPQGKVPRGGTSINESKGTKPIGPIRTTGTRDGNVVKEEAMGAGGAKVVRTVATDATRQLEVGVPDREADGESGPAKHDGNAGQNVNGDETGSGAEDGGQHRAKQAKDGDLQMMDIDIVGGKKIGSGEVIEGNENGSAGPTFGDLLRSEKVAGESVAGSSGAGQSGQLTDEEKELQLQMMHEETFKMQLQLQMMVHRTNLLEKKIQQDASEQMRDEASAGAVASGRSVRGGEGENSEGGAEGGGGDGKKEKDETGRRRSEVAALIREQKAFGKQLEKQREMISQEQKRLQSGGRGGDDEGSNGDGGCGRDETQLDVKEKTIK